MKITKLEKKKRLYLLETDSDQKCYVTEDTIVRFFLSKDKEISEQDWKEIQAFAQLSYGKDLALYYITFKQRTRKEVADYLKKYEIADTIIPTILNNLEQDNWINDKQYTENFIQQNLRNGDKGPQVLWQKLFQKGITKELIQAALDTNDFTDLATKTAEKIVRKNQRKLPEKALQMKVYQQLLAKGFSSQVAKTAIDSILIEKDDADDQELLAKELDKQFTRLSRKYSDYDLKNRLIQTLMRKGFDYDKIKSAIRDYL